MLERLRRAGATETWSIAVIAIAALLGCSPRANVPAPAAAPAPLLPTALHVESYAPIARDLEFMAISAWEDRTERARCVTRWHSAVRADTLTVVPLSLGAAEVERADSLNLWFYATRTRFDTAYTSKVCGDTLPSVHTHDLRFGIDDGPSDADYASAALSRAPFHLIVLVRDGRAAGVIPYAARNRP